MFLVISQNSQEYNCVRDSFLIKLQAKGCNFIKKEYLAQVFSCEFCEISKNTFITEHLQATASYYFILVLNKWVTSTVSCNLYCVANIVSSL